MPQKYIVYLESTNRLQRPVRTRETPRHATNYDIFKSTNKVSFDGSRSILGKGVKKKDSSMEHGCCSVLLRMGLMPCMPGYDQLTHLSQWIIDLA